MYGENHSEDEVGYWVLMHLVNSKDTVQKTLTVTLT